MWLAIAVLGMLLLIWAILDTTKPKNYPPGPRWWPVFGNTFLVRDLLKRTGSLPLSWKTLAEQYGPVCGLKMGLAHHVVVVSERAAVSQVLENQDLDGRPNNFRSQFRTMGKMRGVLTTDGNDWTVHRQFIIQNFDDFGLKEMNDLIFEEAQKCANKLIVMTEQNNVLGISLHRTFQLCVLNILWKWVSGTRFEDDEPSRVKFLQMSKDFLQIPNEAEGFLTYLSELSCILPKDTSYSLFAKIHTQIWALLSEMVWEHKHGAGNKQRGSLIDVYLNEMKESANKISNSNFTEMQLVALIKDIIGAGSETTSASISLAIFMMMTHQKVQTKVQQEIDLLVGRRRPVMLSDRFRLPYVNAVLMETQRMSTVTATSIPHRALRDTKITGYDISENTTVFLNLWSVHMDKEHWGDPEVFRPERFLDANGALKTDPWLIPFGLGRRRCVGERLAEDTLFLTFSMCLQQLRFDVPSAETNTAPCCQNLEELNKTFEQTCVHMSSRLYS